MRVPDRREFTHERLGEEFGTALSAYDTRRRVQVLVDDFLSEDMVRGKNILDVGCGFGYFSQRLKERGARVVACDIGTTLVERTRRLAGCQAEVADALELVSHFGAEKFDGVVSSECIEHVPDPEEAVRQMAGVLRPGGFLSLSTPNILWTPVVKMATVLRLRPFDGFENFSSWAGLRKTFGESGLDAVREYGLHLFPFQTRLYPTLTWCDSRLQFLRWAMINICLLGRKRPSS